jgi:phage terminase small subunit
MDRHELIEKLESGAITVDGMDASTNEGGESEAMQIAVAKVVEKKSKKGKIYGVKTEEQKKQEQSRLTPRQRLFVNSVMSGKTKLQAYRDAYDTNASDAVCSVNANRLLKHPKISALLGSFDADLQEKIIEDSVRTRRFVMEQLVNKVKQGKTEGTQLKALELVGKAIGMFTDRVEQTVEQINTDQLKEELKAHLTLLDNVKPIKKVNG